MRFQVPQFIDVEDKIFGPLTLKQFIYLVGGAGLAYITYALIGNLLISIVFILPIIAFALALAFYKINNKPFIGVIEAAFNYFTGNKLYIWKKIDKVVERKGEVASEPANGFYIPKLSDSKLKDLTWGLDIKQSLNPAQNSEGKKTF